MRDKILTLASILLTATFIPDNSSAYLCGGRIGNLRPVAARERERKPPQEPSQNIRMRPTRDVYSDEFFVLRKNAERVKEDFKLHSDWWTAERKKEFENTIRICSNTAPSDAPREGYVRVVSDEEIEAALSPLPDNMLENITYRRIEGRRLALAWFSEEKGGAIVYRGEVLIPDIPVGSISLEAVKYAKVGFYQETAQDDISFLNEVFKLGLIHEVGELFSEVAGITIYRYLGNILAQRSKWPEREVVYGSVAGYDIRHNFCDYLMKYYVPDSPLLKDLILSDEQKEAIRKILSAAARRPDGPYRRSLEPEKFIQRISESSIVSKAYFLASHIHITFAELFEMKLLQDAVHAVGLDLQKNQLNPQEILLDDQGELVGSVSVQQTRIDQAGWDWANKPVLSLWGDAELSLLEKVENFIRNMERSVQVPKTASSLGHDVENALSSSILRPRAAGE